MKTPDMSSAEREKRLSDIKERYKRPITDGDAAHILDNGWFSTANGPMDMITDYAPDGAKFLREREESDA